VPVIQISIVQGRKPEKIRNLIRQVTNAVARSLETPVETVKVIVTEVAPTHWGSGEQTIAEKQPAGLTSSTYLPPQREGECPNIH
jgi:4-oxalocrotonate tautomerase